jgi:PHD/YefM family antitoxin component YafN of YafNO toxin-antitoxin module
MTAPTKTRDSSKAQHIPRRTDSGKPQFITDENGNKTAVVLSLETWERVAPFLQNDLERALTSDPVQEDVPPSIAKKLRNHAKGKKEPMLTLEEFKAEVQRLQES